METQLEEILELVKKKMYEQGGYTKEAYKQFVNETIGYFQEKGKLSEDDNIEFIEDRLLLIWPEVRDALSEKS